MTVHGPLRSFVLVALILLAAGVAPVTTAFAATDPQRSSDYYDQALQHLGKEDFGAALIELKNALAEDPENLSARLLLGQVHLLLGDGLSAEHAYKRAMRSGADDTLTLMPLAQAYLMQRKYDELLKDIHSGGRPTEVEIQILLARGDALTHLRRLKEGALAYRAASRLDPKSAQPPLGLAKIAILQGEPGTASDLASQAVERDPKLPEAWFFRGEMRRIGGDLSGAVDDLTACIALQTNHLPARLARADALMLLGRWDAAREDVAHMKSIVADDPYASYLEARVLLHDGDASGARQALATAENIIKNMEPSFLRNDPSALLAASLVYYALKNNAEAGRYLNDYIKFRAPLKILLFRASSI